MKTRFMLAGAALFVLLGLPAFSSAQSTQTVRAPRLDQKYDDFRIAFGGGYAYRLGKTERGSSSDFGNLTDQLRNGYNVGMDMQYYFSRLVGIGLNVDFVSSGASLSYATERQNVIYVGPALAIRADGTHGLFTFDMGPGILFWNDKATIGTITGKATATAFGVHLGVGGEFKVSSGVGLGAKLSVDVGSFKKAKSDGQTYQFDKGLSASSLMLTGFISFRTWK